MEKNYSFVRLGNTVMAKWMEKHHELWYLDPQRFLFICNGTEEMFIIETNNEIESNRRVIVYEYDCGHLCNIRSEKNTFVKYLMMVMVAEGAEYLDRTGR